MIRWSTAVLPFAFCPIILFFFYILFWAHAYASPLLICISPLSFSVTKLEMVQLLLDNGDTHDLGMKVLDVVFLRTCASESSSLL